jgi:hypothetical protein
MLKNQYGDLALPLPGQVYTVAHSTSAARYAIPPTWRRKIVNFTSVTSDLYVLFGTAGVMIESAEAAQTVATPEVLSSNWASGCLIPAGTTIPFAIPDDPYVTHFAVDSSSGTGQWSACVASGSPGFGEALPHQLGAPLLWLDAGYRSTLNVDSGAVTVAGWKCRTNGYEFTEASNKPDLLTAAGAGASLIRPAVQFVSGSSEKLISNDATLAAALGGVRPFTLYLNTRRDATGAAHTIFSVGTAGSNNGRWDLTYDASEDIVLTRVTSGAASTTSTFATTINGSNTILITFDGATPLLWVNGTSQAFSGTAAGDVGTTTKVGIGCRAYNTSTADQFASVEICDAMVFPEAFTGAKLAQFQGWIRRRAGL